MIPNTRALAALLLLGCVACNTTVVTPPDASSKDSGRAETDAGDQDAGQPDSGPLDGGFDGGRPDAGSVIPEVSISAPADNAFLTTGTPTFGVSVTAGDPVSVDVIVASASGTVTHLAASQESGASWTATPSSPLATGRYTVKATGTNADEEKGPESAAVSFIIDTERPATPVITRPTAAQLLTTATPVFTLQQAGSPATLTVTLSGTGAVTFNATNNGDGTWSGSPSNPLADGQYVATAVATDALGYDSLRSDSVAFVIDTHVPAAPVVTAPAQGALLTDAAPTFIATSGGTTSAVVFRLTDSSGTTHTLTATGDGNGIWTATSPELPDGDTNVTATASDALGGVSVGSAVVTFSIDAHIPAAPVVASPTGGAILTTSLPTISVTAESGTSGVTITVKDSSGATSTLTAANVGGTTWTATANSPLSDGTATVKAIARSALGHPSAASATVTFVVDTHLPPIPVVTFPASQQVLTTLLPAIRLTAGGTTSSVIVTLVDSLGTTTTLDAAFAAGVWTAQPTVPLATGAITATAVARDALGGESAASAPLHFVVDADAPLAAVTSPEDGDVIASLRPQFAAEVSSGLASTLTFLVEDSSGETTVLEALDDGAGHWLAVPEFDLAEGAASVTAAATDAAGNSAGASATVHFTIDTHIPNLQVTAPAEGTIFTTGTPTFRALVNSSDVASVTFTVVDHGGNTTVLSGSNQGSGRWTASPSTALVAGAATVTAEATNSLGTTTATDPVSFVIDLDAPGAPAITAPLANALITSATPAVTVHSDSASTARVVVTLVDAASASTTLEAIPGGGGDWVATVATALPDGPVSATAVAYDAVGGASPASPARAFIVDAHIPPAPTFTAPSSGELLFTATPTLRLLAPGSVTAVTLTLTDSTGTVRTLQAVNLSGAEWTALTPTLADGTVSVSAVSTDALGGTSEVSTTLSFVIDTHVPDAPVITSPAANALITSATPAVTVSADGTTNSVLVTFVAGGNTTVEEGIDNGSGTWTATPSSALPDGTVVVSAVAIDALGGQSGASTSVSFVVDTHIPAAPVFLAPAADSIVSTQTPSLIVESGSTTTSVTITVTDSTGTPQTLSAVNNGDGTWTAVPHPDLANGRATATAIAADALGGVSSVSLTRSFIVDTNIPDAPTINSPTSAEVVTTATPTVIVASGGTTSVVTVTFTDANGAHTAVATNNGDGTWSATPGVALTLGSITVSAVAADALGGVSPASSSVTFVVDTIIPTLTLTSPTGSDLVSVLRPKFTATVTHGTPTTVVVTVWNSAGASTDLQATNNGDGTWSATPSADLTFGPTVVTVVGTDYLGNSGAVSAPKAVYIRGRLSADGSSYDSFPDGTDAKVVFLNQANNSTRAAFDNSTRIPSSDLPGGQLPPL